MVNAELQVELRAEATRLGFAACGFTAATPDAQRAERLERFLGEGRHGSMEWMEARKAQRAADAPPASIAGDAAGEHAARAVLLHSERL